jgi:hypothetical protein
MQIDAQVIENMLITFIIHNYDGEKEKNNFEKNTNMKIYLSISLKFKLKSILVK